MKQYLAASPYKRVCSVPQYMIIFIPFFHLSLSLSLSHQLIHCPRCERNIADFQCKILVKQSLTQLSCKLNCILLDLAFFLNKIPCCKVICGLIRSFRCSVSLIRLTILTFSSNYCINELNGNPFDTTTKQPLGYFRNYRISHVYRTIAKIHKRENENRLLGNRQTER